MVDGRGGYVVGGWWVCAAVGGCGSDGKAAVVFPPRGMRSTVSGHSSCSGACSVVCVLGCVLTCSGATSERFARFAGVFGFFVWSRSDHLILVDFLEARLLVV